MKGTQKQQVRQGAHGKRGRNPEKDVVGLWKGKVAFLEEEDVAGNLEPGKTALFKKSRKEVLESEEGMAKGVENSVKQL